MSLLAPMYHSISRTRPDNSFTIEESRFAAHLRWLKLTRHQSVTISQIIDWLDGRASLPRRAFILTFDDGYLDNFEFAVPLLQRFQFTACIFITTSWCREREREHVRLGKKNCPMLTWNELRKLANSGIEIGSHTISHPFLTEQKSEDAWEEIYKSKLEIERILGLEVQAFSYPNSKHDQSIRNMVRQAGYKLAFGGVSGLNHHDADRYNLYRPCVYNPCPVPEFVFSVCTGLHLRERYWNWRKG